MEEHAQHAREYRTRMLEQPAKPLPQIVSNVYFREGLGGETRAETKRIYKRPRVFDELPGAVVACDGGVCIARFAEYLRAEEGKRRDYKHDKNENSEKRGKRVFVPYAGEDFSVQRMKRDREYRGEKQRVEKRSEYEERKNPRGRKEYKEKIHARIFAVHGVYGI